MVSRERWILTPFELQSRGGARDEEPTKRVTPGLHFHALSFSPTLFTRQSDTLYHNHIISSIDHDSIFKATHIRFMFHSAPRPLAPEVEVEAAGAAIAVAHTT